ncbi:hypothetical protein [Streptomyces bauhiniae]|uniref:Uncharacterized protein n=1 Tax=Streptomyces bauhiniae TaxID=2340725 RepID=A0A7K3QX60_9ACTN|nr:hypothetical protein [Streptomyces bauhiniae]NEB94527.1 hypothetical protein [Streptomyces bauhiniae]
MVRVRTVLERFPAGGPRGSWPAEEFAHARREEGMPVEVVMDLATDTFLVILRSADGVDRTSERGPLRPASARGRGR